MSPFAHVSSTQILKLIKLSCAGFTREGTRILILVYIGATLYRHKHYVKLYQTSPVSQKHFTVK